MTTPTGRISIELRPADHADMVEAAGTLDSRQARPVRSRADRDAALDFTKGALVCFMILYHWINYFVSREGDFYRYLRFITPSFIFLAGFLVSRVYLTRRHAGQAKIWVRLLDRSCRLLLLFTLLNVAGSVVYPQLWSVGSVWDNVIATYVTGNESTAAFLVLVPISYLLLFSSGLLGLRTNPKPLLLYTAVTLVAAIQLLSGWHLTSVNLELFTVGVIGVVVGEYAGVRVHVLNRRFGTLLVLYASHLAAVSLWGETFVLQVVGVLVNVALVYAIGRRAGSAGWLNRWLIRLGRYSLLAYIAQIGIILAISEALRRWELAPPLRLTVSFIAAFSLTMAAVQTVEHLRRRSAKLDKLYRLAFA